MLFAVSLLMSEQLVRGGIQTT